jgi:hypothetical protein
MKLFSKFVCTSMGSLLAALVGCVREDKSGSDVNSTPVGASGNSFPTSCELLPGYPLFPTLPEAKKGKRKGRVKKDSQGDETVSVTRVPGSPSLMRVSGNGMTGFMAIAACVGLESAVENEDRNRCVEGICYERDGG